MILPAARDRWSTITHLFGAIAAAVGLVFLLIQAGTDPVRLVGALSFGLALIALFSASSAYHYFNESPEQIAKLRRLDHAAIYVLIAGTNVPTIIHLLDGTWRVAMLVLILGLGVAGVLFKVVWFNTASKAGTLLYVAMGWAIALAGPELWPVITGYQAALLALGGFLYTFGAVIYAIKWPNPLPGVFGSHEVWHLFVLSAAAAHYFYVLDLITSPYATL